MIDFLILLATFTLIDGIWLGKIAPAFYKKHIGSIMRLPPDWAAAAIFYVGYITGLYFLGFRQSETVTEAFMYGAALGVFAYGTYDLTNKATLKDWPWIVVIVDIVWGLLVSGSAVSLAFLISMSI